MQYAYVKRRTYGGDGDICESCLSKGRGVTPAWPDWPMARGPEGLGALEGPHDSRGKGTLGPLERACVYERVRGIRRKREPILKEIWGLQRPFSRSEKNKKNKNNLMLG